MTDGYFVLKFLSYSQLGFGFGFGFGFGIDIAFHLDWAMRTGQSKTIA